MKKLAALLLLIAVVVHAPPIKLAWDDNPPEEQVFQYILYVGPESGKYTERIVVPNGAHTYTLMVTSRVYVALTAQNIWALESDFSNEITIPPTNRPGPPFLPFPPAPNPPWTNLRASLEAATMSVGPWQTLFTDGPHPEAPTLYYRITFRGGP